MLGSGKVERGMESAGPMGPELYFQAQVDSGRFMIQRSRGSGEHVFYPRLLAPGTGADDLEWVEASGLATVYSTTVVLPARGSDADPYNIALVDLDEGPRMLTRVIDIAPDAVTIGMRVRARIEQLASKAVVLFAPQDPA